MEAGCAFLAGIHCLQGWCVLGEGSRLPARLARKSILEYFIGKRSWEERLVGDDFASRLFRSSVIKNPHKWWCVHPNTYTPAFIAAFVQRF